MSSASGERPLAAASSSVLSPLAAATEESDSPAVVAWMTRYQRDVLRHFGYSAKRGCGEADVCPAFSLPDLFDSGGRTPASADATRWGK